MILQLAQRGELRLSDHIDRFLDGIPGGHRVTIKRLLNQTSGVTAGVFDRLGLHDTRLASSKPVPAPVGHGYFYNSANFPLDTSGWNFSWSWTAGGITSTLRDMKRYCPAMATGHGLIGARMERKRLNFVDIIPADRDSWGRVRPRGIRVATAAGTFIGHDGAVPGYDTLCVYSPQSRTTIVAFGTTSVELDPISPGRIPVQMLFNVAPALAQVVAAGTY